MIATLTVHLYLPGCASLKEKRGRIKSIMSRLQREFNLSVAEIGLQDTWQEAVIGCAMIGSERRHLESAMHTIEGWIHAHWTDGDVLECRLEW